MKAVIAALCIFLGAPALARDCADGLNEHGYGLVMLAAKALEKSVIDAERVRRFAEAAEWANLFDLAPATLVRNQYRETFARLDAGLNEGERARVKTGLLKLVDENARSEAILRDASEATAEVLKPEAVEDWRPEVAGYSFNRVTATPFALEDGRPVLMARFARTDSFGQGIPGSALETFAFDPTNPNPGERVRLKPHTDRNHEFSFNLRGEIFSADTSGGILQVKNLATGQRFPPFRFNSPLEGPPQLFRAGDRVYAALGLNVRFKGPAISIVDLGERREKRQHPSGSKFLQPIEIGGEPWFCMSRVEEATLDHDRGHAVNCFHALTGEAREIAAESLRSNVSSFFYRGKPTLIWGGDGSLTLYDAESASQSVVRGDFGSVTRVYAFDWNGVPHAFVVAKERKPVLLRLTSRSTP